MNEFPLLTTLLASGAVIEHESYCYDEFDADGWYTVNGVEIEADTPDGSPLLHEIWNADANDVLVWKQLLLAPGHQHDRLVGFTADGGA